MIAGTVRSYAPPGFEEEFQYPVTTSLDQGNLFTGSPE
jgi:hypothetical protein